MGERDLNSFWESGLLAKKKETKPEKARKEEYKKIQKLRKRIDAAIQVSRVKEGKF